MKKKIITLCMCAALMLGLVGCAAVNEAVDSTEVVGLYDGEVFTYTDADTGVEYICYSTYEGCAITPRLNADGTLYTNY